MIQEAVATSMVLLVGATLVALALRSYPGRKERRLLALGFSAHVLAAFAQVWITHGYYGSGDMSNYFATGAAIADLVSYRPSQFGPELIALLLQRASAWPFVVLGAGSSTGTMSAIAAALNLLLGDSMYAACLFMSVAAFFGQLALYRVYRDLYPESLRPRLIAATMLIPSVVFWSSGVLKEAVAMAAFGWIILGLHRFVQRRRVLGIILIILGGLWVALVKPYILFALGLAGGVWWYWRRSLDASRTGGVTVRPLYLAAGALVVIGIMVALGELFPRYALEQVGEETARLQRVGAQVGGGSVYEVSEGSDRSMVGQLAFAPFALLTALFRPVVFEVRNAMMAINAVETTALSALFIAAVVRRSWRSIWIQVSRSPSLVFALVFVVTFGTAVGLATTNLGTLSRYRIPLMPLFAALLFVWTARAASPVLAAGSVRDVARARRDPPLTPSSNQDPDALR